jgi:tol-pal system protein YbgF
MVKKLIKIVLLSLLLSLPLYPQIVTPLFNYNTNEITQAKYFYDKDLFSKSRQLLEHAIRSYSDPIGTDKAVMMQAIIDASNGNFALSDKALGKLISNDKYTPYRADAAMLRAYLAFDQKDYKNSEKLFSVAKTISDEEYKLKGEAKFNELSNNALYWRAVSLTQSGHYQDAQPLFEECFSKYPNGKFADDALFALGMSAEVNRQYELAINYYRTLQKKYPYSNSIVASRVREVNDNLILRDAISALITIESTNNIIKHIYAKDSTGLRYEPQSYFDFAQEEVLYLRGEAYNLAGNYEQSESFLHGFLETFTNSTLTNYVRLGYAWSLLNQNKNQEAIKVYETVLTSTDQTEARVIALAELYKAIAIKRNGDVETAQKDLANLTSLSDYPYLAQALLELGQIYYEKGEYEKAVKTLDRAEREATEALVQVRIQLLLGASNLELKRWDKAIKPYKTAEQIALKSSYIFMPQKDVYIREARLKLGISFVKNSRNSEAIPPLLAYLSENKNGKRNDEALFWISEAYYRIDLLNNAIEKYSSLLDLYPASSYKEDALYGLGWSYFRLKNFNKSSETFETMIREFPLTKYAMEVLTRQADGYYVTRNFRKAVDTYRKAALHSPNTEEGQYSAYQLAHALYQMGSYEEAITAMLSFVRTYSKSPYAPNSLYLTGWIRFQQKKYLEAIDDFRFLLQAYPQSVLVPRAHFAIADGYYNLENYEQALKEYNLIVDEYSNSSLAPDAVKGMQYCYNALGKPEEAFKIADKYVASNPTSPFAAEFVFKKGEMFFNGKNYNDAINEYDNFIKKYPDNDKNAEAMFWMGKSYVSLNDLPNAERTFKSVISKYGKSDFAPQSMLELGLLKKQTADISAADSILIIIAKNYPDNPISAQAGYERASIKFSMGDTLSAINIFRDVYKQYPNQEYGEQSSYRIAMYFRIKGWLDSAVVEFQKLIHSNLNPSLSAESQYRIGEIRMRQEKLEDAVTAFIAVKENFAGIEDWFTLALLNMGECYERLQQNEKAIETYQAISTLRPDDDFGKTAKRRLKQLEK